MSDMFYQQNILKILAKSAKNICEEVYFLVILPPLHLLTLGIYKKKQTLLQIPFLKLQGFFRFFELSGEQLFVKHLLL